jgi:hypothetical protein
MRKTLLDMGRLLSFQLAAGSALQPRWERSVFLNFEARFGADQPGALWDRLLPLRVGRSGKSVGERFLCADAANCGEQYRKDDAN